MEYQRRLERALDYIEDNLESSFTLEDLAYQACYSPSHFIWIFRATIGLPPMEYVRRRRLTEAARAIIAGEDVVDTVYRFGFSAQDAFTRSFKNAIGMPPGRLRQSDGKEGTYTPALVLEQGGGNNMLNFNLDCDPLKSILRVQQLLTEEVKGIVEKIATEPIGVRSIDPHISDELCQARVIRVEDGIAHIDTAVFFEEDLKEIHVVADRWGSDLAARVFALDEEFPEMSPQCKRLVVGMNGIDVGVFDLLISEGYAFNHRQTDGRYAGAKIDFYEVCDAYDRFEPYISGGYGSAGKRFAVKIIGQDQGLYSYLHTGMSLSDDGQFAFRSNANKYLTDALGELLLGEISHPSLIDAAEAAGLLSAGKASVPVITTADAPKYWTAAKFVRGTVAEFLRDNAKGMKDFLKGTSLGKQGVSPTKLTVDLMRYIRMVTHKSLYDYGFYTDCLPEDGNITVFRELTAKIDGK